MNRRISYVFKNHAIHSSPGPIFKNSPFVILRFMNRIALKKYNLNELNLIELRNFLNT